MQPCRVRSFSSSPSSWCCSPDESRAGPAQNQKGEAGDEGKKKEAKGMGLGQQFCLQTRSWPKDKFSLTCAGWMCASNTSLMGLHACL